MDGKRGAPFSSDAARSVPPGVFGVDAISSNLWRSYPQPDQEKLAVSSDNGFPLFFSIATPIFVSGVIGLFTGIIPVHIFFAMLVALYIILCVANAMDRSS